ncbi:helix-turn-helix domain-containing protein [Levilactobacillus yonginensis]|uniref:helix-turn-helix domain-containing protein n=1 Tax=Levilactobacillus yonginensis TaxID=1054041 RepID=UPI000F792CF4|nr:helix-turn-helix domain-containing protein [Levilactobacillus yonginensis]
MPRTRFTAMEKLDILTGLSQTKLNRSKYLEQYGIYDSTIRSWRELYKRDGLDGLKERHIWTRYSAKTKQQAVEAYLNGEGSLVEISNRFGLRSNTQLHDWIKKFQYNGTNKSLTATPSRRQVRIMSRKTTFEERIEIVEYVTAGKHSYSQASEHFNVSYQQVRAWVLKSKDGGYTALKDGRGRTKPVEEMTEVERLKLENRQLKAQLKEQEVMELFAKKFRELQNKE